MRDRLSYDVVVVGGGPAGATAALYTTRLGHSTAVFEKEGGRHAAVNHVHNVYGVSEDVSGRALSSHAVAQLEAYGADYYLDPVANVRRADGNGDGSTDGRFVVEAEHATVAAERVVLATGFTDREPSVPGLQTFTGHGLHYCLHCDGYLLGDASAYVLGHGDHAAGVAMILLNFTGDVDLLLDGRDPEWSDDRERQIRAHPVERVDTEVTRAFADDEDDDRLGGLEFADGREREYRGGFAVYGKSYNTGLAESLGCALADDGAVDVDERFETSVDGVYAVGDLTHGQNQTVVAMGDGAKAGMAIDKDLRRYPRPPGEEVDESAVPSAPADLRSRMRLVRERDSHPGLGESESVE
ncbi:NAD(P)/FAD-dependent oxidoreductase [Halosimplex aquaticum]|uniref:NAD(P)/FAD-dependent oxidoreductase n=1 Tax=Halosimplex aquaticum TaxID=3026162 RepID=A0ABD5Y2T5_9EURY|nr:NAD(P)/FAD-dependent oxidoreductase [Halosimplex aquaticum]